MEKKKNSKTKTKAKTNNKKTIVTEKEIAKLPVPKKGA